MKVPLPVVFALGTALCWGLYGPVLGQARNADPDHSPFKPYVGIGVAYIVWAIVGGMAGMAYKGDTFNFIGAGSILGFAAGSLGAWGALNLTLAMFSGGAKMPHVVMPIVFGGAVTVAAIVSVIASGALARTPPLLWFGIIGMLLCTIIVAANTPHGGPSHTKTEQPAATDSAAEGASESVERSESS